MSGLGFLNKLYKALKAAPRDKHGRIPLAELDTTAYQDLLNTPSGLKNIVYRGEFGEPALGTGTPLFVAEDPRQALYYAAEFGSYPKNGYLSIFEAPLADLPKIGIDELLARTKSAPNAPSDFNRGLFEAVPEFHDKGGMLITDWEDYALKRDLAAHLRGDTYETKRPQGFIWDHRLLQQRKKGGLVQMRSCK